jgi:hypothetical protein
VGGVNEEKPLLHPEPQRTWSEGNGGFAKNSAVAKLCRSSVRALWRKPGGLALVDESIRDLYAGNGNKTVVSIFGSARSLIPERTLGI